MKTILKLTLMFLALATTAMPALANGPMKAPATRTPASATRYYYVYYRWDPSYRWTIYGVYYRSADAHYVANWLSYYGLEVYVR